MYNWITLLYSTNYHSIVNQLYFNIKFEKLQKPKTKFLVLSNRFSLMPCFPIFYSFSFFPGRTFKEPTVLHKDQRKNKGITEREQCKKPEILRNVFPRFLPFNSETYFFKKGVLFVVVVLCSWKYNSKSCNRRVEFLIFWESSRYPHFNNE